MQDSTGGEATFESRLQLMGSEIDVRPDLRRRLSAIKKRES